MPASSMTVRRLVERAAGRSPYFQAQSLPDGMLVGLVEDRQRSLLLLTGGAVDGLLSTTVEIATVISGTLVGSDNGVPVYQTTYLDGYATHSDVGVPYWDFTESPIASDPFGEHGGTPGFPLPTDFIKLIKVVAIYTDDRIGTVDIISEPQRLARLRSSCPSAFVSGNRLVPVRPLSQGNSNDFWSAGIASLQVSYLAAPSVTSLDATVTLPLVLMEALIAGLCETMAASATTMPAAERARFAQAARATEEALDTYSIDVVGTASTTFVHYRG